MVQGYKSYNNRLSPKDKAKSEAEKFFKELNFNSRWITNGADEDLVEFADKAGKEMSDKKLTNSKIRSFYGEIKRIQMGTFESEKSSFYLLRPKIAYAVGRDDTNEGLYLFQSIFEASSHYVTNGKTYGNLCNLIEAVLAYHKYYGGK